jgi:hypothetical protein
MLLQNSLSMSRKHGPQILYADATLNISTSLSIWSDTISYGIHGLLMLPSPSGVISSQQLTVSETMHTGWLAATYFLFVWLSHITWSMLCANLISIRMCPHQYPDSSNMPYISKISTQWYGIINITWTLFNLNFCHLGKTIKKRIVMTGAHIIDVGLKRETRTRWLIVYRKKGNMYFIYFICESKYDPFTMSNIFPILQNIKFKYNCDIQSVVHP